jgi:hypothetical protein
LRIARIVWSKSAINEKKKLSSLIVKTHNAKQTNRLIRDDLLHEYSQISCELFVNNCKIKQCFNCQRYDHIDKICRHERRCSVCAKSHDDSTCKVSINKRKCVNCESNHSIWSFQCKIKMTEKNRISNIWRTKSILHSIKFKNVQHATFRRLDIDAQSMLAHEEITSSTSFSCSSIKTILIQNEKIAFENIMHLEIENYFVNEITSKRTLSQDLERSMSSSSRQRSVNVVQISSNQTSNAFDVLRNRSSTRASQKTMSSTQSQTFSQFQIISRSRKRSFNSKKTTESRQNDDELWRHKSRLQFYSTMCETIKKTRWCRFWSILELKNMICWQFKNHDVTSAFRRRTIRSTSTFIFCMKTRKTWELAFMSTLDCILITDRYVMFLTMCASFVSRWRIIDESMCIMFTMSRSTFTRRAIC